MLKRCLGFLLLPPTAAAPVVNGVRVARVLGVDRKSFSSISSSSVFARVSIASSRLESYAKQRPLSSLCKKGCAKFFKVHVVHGLV